MIGALLWRHLAAVVAVVLAAEFAVYQVRHTPPAYAAGATVVFSSPGPPDGVLARRDTPALITTETMMAELMASRWAQDLVRRRGGTGQFQVSPENTANLQYPDYADPLATITVTAPEAAAAQRTFAAVYSVLARQLAGLQARTGVPPPLRIQLRLVSVSAPAPQPGSPVRVLAGLALLTVMAVFLVVTFLDRRRGRWPGPAPVRA
jgi:hypothetical protein